MASKSLRIHSFISFGCIISLAMTACSPKERPKSFAQGDSADGYYAMADYKDAEFPLETKNAIGKKESGEKLTIKVTSFENQRNGKTLLPAVKAESSSKLVNEILNFEMPMHAKENTKGLYKLSFKFQKNWVDVLKLGKSEDFNAQEVAVGTQLKDSRVAIPYMRMAVSYYYLEPVKNSDNEDTHILRMFPTEDLNKATHFKLNLSSYPEYLTLPSVETVLPKDFFKGEWFYSAILLESKSGSGADFLPTGFTLSQAFSIKSVSRIRFDIEQFRLVAKNVNIAEGVKKDSQSSSIQEDEVLVIPVENVDLNSSEDDPRKSGLNYAYTGENHRFRKTWTDREYLKLDVTEIQSIVSKALGHTSTLLDVKVTDDYLGFTVEYHTIKTKIRYSLKRAHNPLKGKLAFSDDMDNRFGYFTTDKEAVYNPNEVRASDFDKYVLINRFFPEQKGPNYKKIVFNFSNTSPKEPAVFRQAAKDAVLEWSKAFKIAGVDAELVLDETKDVDLGDIRYNVIDLIDDPMNSGLLGYGPTLADTKSGEIVASSTHIYASNFINILTENLREYVYIKLGIIKNENLIPIDNFIENLLVKIDNPANRSEISRIKDQTIASTKSPMLQALSSPNSLLDSSYNSLGTDQINSQDKAGMKVMIAKERSSQAAHRLSQCMNISITMADVAKRIEENCSDKNPSANLIGYINKVVSMNKNSVNKVTHIPGEEAQVLKACAVAIAYPMLKHTVLHELGHNLGLRHNFIASADWRNFADDVNAANYQKIREQVSSSSVMDYLSPAAKDMETPGPYDIGAIRFGYLGKVEVVNDQGKGTGEFQKLEESMDISRNEVVSGKKLKKFKFCSDEQIQDSPTEPVYASQTLCYRHDYGTSAFEITKNMIDQFNASLNLYRYRQDLLSSRLRHSDHLSRYFDYVYFMPLSKIYVDWRLKLAKVINDSNKVSLFSYSNEKLDELVKKAAEKMDENQRYEFLDYYAASRLIVNLLVDLSSKYPKVCVTEDKDKNTVAVSFSEIAKAASLVGEFVKNCQSDYSKSYIQAKGGTNSISEFGEYFEDLQFNPEVLKSRTFYVPDIVGIANLVKDLGYSLDRPLLTKREQIRGGLIPSFAEEPLIRDTILANAYDRALKGLPITKDNQIVYLPIFSESAQAAASLLNPVSNRLRNTTEVGEASRITNSLIVRSKEKIQDLPLDHEYWVESLSNKMIKYSIKKQDGARSRATEVLMKYDVMSTVVRLLDNTQDLQKISEMIETSKSRLEKVKARRTSADDDMDVYLMLVSDFEKDTTSLAIAKLLMYQNEINILDEVKKFTANEFESRAQMKALEALIAINFER